GEGCKIDDTERDKKYSAGLKIGIWAKVLAPKCAGPKGKKDAMRGYPTITPLAADGEAGEMPVKPEPPGAPGIIGKAAEHRLRAAVMLPIRLQEMDGGTKILRGDLRILRRDLLVGGNFESVQGGAFPTLDPAAAKATITVENKQRLFHHASVSRTGWSWV